VSGGEGGKLNASQARRTCINERLGEERKKESWEWKGERREGKKVAFTVSQPPKPIKILICDEPLSSPLGRKQHLNAHLLSLCREENKAHPRYYR